MATTRAIKGDTRSLDFSSYCPDDHSSGSQVALERKFNLN